MRYRGRMASLLTLTLLAGLVLMSVDTTVTQAQAKTRTSELWAQTLEGWRGDGLKPATTGWTLDAGNAKSGRDPYGPNGYKGRNYYNGGSFFYGEAVGPVYTAAQPFDSVVVSWNADTPSGTWVELRARVLQSRGWTKEYSLGVWASDSSTVKRHSVDGQGDANGNVETDTLMLNSAGVALQVRAVLFSTDKDKGPVLKSVAASLVGNGANPTMLSPQSAWGKDIDVPQRSQMIYPDGGEVWCSPTSTSMIMEYWSKQGQGGGLNQTVPSAATATDDWVYDGNGNWPFNVAYASSLGLSGYVTRLVSLTQAEAWIKIDRPLIASISWQPGQLPGAPIPQSSGHLLVIRGFAANGDVIVNDPAADPRLGQSVRRTYPRVAFEQRWLAGSGGTVYVLMPIGSRTPNEPADFTSAWSTTPGSRDFANSYFKSTWNAADLEVIQGRSGRGWTYGPQPYSAAIEEDYQEGVDGRRTVQYFDKSRMEITNPRGNIASPYFVTNGLLTVELVSGRMQTGDNRFTDRSPSAIPVAGDPVNPGAPTYASFRNLATLPGSPRPAAKAIGQSVTNFLSEDGITTGSSPDPAVKLAYYDDVTGHNIPNVLYSWLIDKNRSGLADWIYVLGRPISEPYWAIVRLNGKPTPVLMQLFERRALTYTPSNPAQFQIEMGNIGQHYYRWRYQG